MEAFKKAAADLAKVEKNIILIKEWTNIKKVYKNWSFGNNSNKQWDKRYASNEILRK